MRGAKVLGGAAVLLPEWYEPKDANGDAVERRGHVDSAKWPMVGGTGSTCTPLLMYHSATEEANRLLWAQAVCDVFNRLRLVMCVRMGSATSTNAVVFVSSAAHAPTLPDGRWTHIGMRYGENVLTLFVDGKQRQQVSTVAPASVATTQAAVYLSQSADLGVGNKLLSPSQVASAIMAGRARLAGERGTHDNSGDETKHADVSEPSPTTSPCFKLRFRDPAIGPQPLVAAGCNAGAPQSFRGMVRDVVLWDGSADQELVGAWAAAGGAALHVLTECARALSTGGEQPVCCAVR